MKVFLDTEFVEGVQNSPFNSKPTIDLISVGMVTDSDREYYEVCKEFNVKHAWLKWDGEYHELTTFQKYHGMSPRKKYWIRENVLKPIFDDFNRRNKTEMPFSLSNFKLLLKKYGKTREEMAINIKNFIYYETISDGGQIVSKSFIPNKYPEVKFYTYFGDYDWVVFCWLFGRMIDLPKGFPMYARDLKQNLDEKNESRANLKNLLESSNIDYEKDNNLIHPLNLKNHKEYPKQDGEHIAINDAKWNKELYEFLKKW